MKRPVAEAKFESHFHLHLRSDLHLVRKVWHMFMGLLVVAVYEGLDISRTMGVVILGSVLGLDLLVEMTRLRVPAFNDLVIRYWGLVMRSCERQKLSGVPYYLAASILAVGIFPKPIAVLSILYLAFGDPIASLFGILYGSKSIKIANGKSLVGSTAGVVTCALVTLVFLSGLHLPTSTLLALTAVGGLAGGAAELLPLEVDDNFSIPIVSGFALWLSFILLGI